jgi:hypothetical protein
MNYKVPSYVIFSIILPLFLHWTKQNPVRNTVIVFIHLFVKTRLVFVLQLL